MSNIYLGAKSFG